MKTTFLMSLAIVSGATVSIATKRLDCFDVGCLTAMVIGMGWILNEAIKKANRW